MTYSIVKALHIISFTCWFAGLFYVVRLFIYNTEARGSSQPHSAAFQAQFNTMQHRLWYGITWPAMISTVFFGAWLIYLIDGLRLPWMHIKLTLVALLIGYHLLLGNIHRKLKAGHSQWRSKTLRAVNEVATLFLVGIVFIAVLKSSLTLNIAGVVLGLFTVLLVGGFLIYQAFRKKP